MLFYLCAGSPHDCNVHVQCELQFLTQIMIFVFFSNRAHSISVVPTPAASLVCLTSQYYWQLAVLRRYYQ